MTQTKTAKTAKTAKSDKSTKSAESTKTTSDKKPEQPRCMTVAEIELSLKRLQDVPEECERDVKDAAKDIKRAKKGTIIACTIFGIIATYELGYMIFGIATKKTDTIYTTLLVLIMNLMFILYEIRDYQNRKNFIEMYITSRKVLAAWAKATIEGLNREVALALQIEELKGKGKKKNGTTKKTEASK